MSTPDRSARSTKPATASLAIAPERQRPSASVGNTASGPRRPLTPGLLRDLPDETRRSCCGFSSTPCVFFKAHGIKVHRVMTDNGTSCRSHRYPRRRGSASSTSSLSTARPRQWQARAPRPDRAVRMGLCQILRKHRIRGPTYRSGSARLASPAWQPKIQATHQPTRPKRG